MGSLAHQATLIEQVRVEPRLLCFSKTRDSLDPFARAGMVLLAVFPRYCTSRKRVTTSGGQKMIMVCFK